MTDKEFFEQFHCNVIPTTSTKPNAGITTVTRKKKTHIIEIEEGVWLAPWSGDPGRTLVQTSAQAFTEAEAQDTLYKLRRNYPDKFLLARITTP